MANNIFLYDFNGSVRRNKRQEAIFKDLAQKDDFLRRIANERVERQLLTRKNAAATKIQAAFRSYCARKKVFAFVRAKFDAVGKADNICVLEAQIGRLSFFFSRTHDVSRTVSLSSDAVSLSGRVQLATSIAAFRREQLLNCVLSVLGEVKGNVPYVPLLRFIEVFLNEASFISATFCNLYFESFFSLFVNHFSLPEPLEIKEWLPPRADTILSFLISPFDLVVSSNLRSRLYYHLFLSLTLMKSEMHVICYVVPFLGKMVNSNKLCFSEIIRVLADENLYSGMKIEQINLLAYVLSVITGSSATESLGTIDATVLLSAFSYFVKHIFRFEERAALVPVPEFDSDEDEGSLPGRSAMRNAKLCSIGSTDFYIETISAVLSLKGLCNSFVNAALLSDESCARLAVLIHFLQEYNSSSCTIFLNAISLHRSFVSRLWHNITSMKSKSVFGTSQTLLSILEKGDCISEVDMVLMLPLLSLFVTLFSNMLTIADDDDFISGGKISSMMPFGIKEIALITAEFRDLTLGLIDVAFPVVPSSTKAAVAHLAMKNSKWSDIFRRVTALTKMLYERDCRLHYMPPSFWSNHNRQVVVSSSMWRVGQRRRRTRGRPFEFVRLMLRERNGDEEEEPPSAIELRNFSILMTIPFVLPFIQRVEMFNEVIMRDKAQTGLDSFSRETYHVTVHRGSIYEDAFAALSPMKAPDLRNVLRVQMVNWQGLSEAGIDGGGIFREFMSELLQTVVDPARGFFTTTHDQTLYPNPLAMSLYSDFHDHFYFIGRIIAKLIYEGLLADLRFADFFVLQWLGTARNGMLDLEYVKSYDPLVHSNLKYLKYCAPEEVETLDLDFSVLVDNLGVTEKVGLKKGGDEIKVTAENRSEYIALYVNYFLCTRIAPMVGALRAGVRSVLDVEWLRMFSPGEISVLIGGVDAEINFEELKKFAVVHNVKSDDDRLYVESFWVVLSLFTTSEKRKFLKFVTGCPRPPLMGFKALNPPMGIQLLHQEPDRLPTAGTCMNLLKLPVYPEFEILRSKLRFAISAGAGFELS